MCRLLAVTPADRKDEPILERFRMLADCGCVPRGDKSGHRDGWGIALYENQKRVRLLRNPKDASRDPLFMRSAHSLLKKKRTLLIGHLRKASVGGRSIRNTHPFCYRNFTFAHNGSVGAKGAVPFTLSPSAKRLVKGTTDSEKVFHFLIGEIGSNPDPANERGAIRRNAARDRQGPYSAINFLFSDGKLLWALREPNPRHPLAKKERLVSYYSLYLWEQEPRSQIIIASEPIQNPVANWRLLTRGELVEIDLLRRSFRSYHI